MSDKTMLLHSPLFIVSELCEIFCRHRSMLEWRVIFLHFYYESFFFVPCKLFEFAN